MAVCESCIHNNVCKYGENRSNGMYCTGEKCRQYKSTADVAEVKHGEWDDSGRYKFADGSLAVRCTVCGCSLHSDEYKKYHWHYCPNCGAKMDGGKAE